MRRSVASMSGSSVASSAGTRSNDANAVWRRALRVERRDADQPVHAALAVEQPVRVATLDGERRGRDAGLGARLHLVDLDVEAAPLAPAGEHAQEHLGPVGGVGAAGTGVDLADRVALVVLAGEQRAQLELVELADETGDPLRDLGLDRVVTLLAAELVERLDVGEPLLEADDEVDVVLGPGQLAGHRPGGVGVVPEAGLARLHLELLDPRRGRIDAQVRARVGDAALEIGEVVGEVAHREPFGEGDDGARSAAVAELELLAAAAVAGLVAARGLVDPHRACWSPRPRRRRCPRPRPRAPARRPGRPRRRPASRRSPPPGPRRRCTAGCGPGSGARSR